MNKSLSDEKLKELIRKTILLGMQSTAIPKSTWLVQNIYWMKDIVKALKELQQLRKENKQLRKREIEHHMEAVRFLNLKLELIGLCNEFAKITKLNRGLIADISKGRVEYGLKLMDLLLDWHEKLMESIDDSD